MRSGRRSSLASSSKASKLSTKVRILTHLRKCVACATMRRGRRSSLARIRGSQSPITSSLTARSTSGASGTARAPIGSTSKAVSTSKASELAPVKRSLTARSTIGASGTARAPIGSQFTQFTCFTCCTRTKVQILAPAALLERRAPRY